MENNFFDFVNQAWVNADGDEALYRELVLDVGGKPFVDHGITNPAYLEAIDYFAKKNRAYSDAEFQVALVRANLPRGYSKIGHLITVHDELQKMDAGKTDATTDTKTTDEGAKTDQGGKKQKGGTAQGGKTMKWVGYGIVVALVLVGGGILATSGGGKKKATAKK